ncbi:hypothetical protein HZY83_07260 [Gemella sp. GH3]|uniref:lactococcin 972 family bacteriocin n=1 Tax=unclassified Gemella TaxID=2624949 RepID=UPI0015D035E5|nr:MULTISPECIES: lactococcin 972 family bacteriocin [unclassified Gemella]MBF0714472.1 hypothetical protein [Gemella sp. GH3.1]NYS51424.1 hypothetical protein [Gemella sp. GH3]
MERGHWHYYTKDGDIHSDYQNHYMTHSSAVRVGDRTNSSGWKSPGHWAFASMATSWFKTSQAYYNVL